MAENQKRLYASIGGTILVALCCFTPILVLALTARGLAALTRYLDVVLLPALAVLVAVTWRSYRRYAQASRP